MEVVEEFAAHLEVEFSADFLAALGDMFGLHRDVSCSIKSDVVWAHTYSLRCSKGWFRTRAINARRPARLSLWNMIEHVVGRVARSTVRAIVAAILGVS